MVIRITFHSISKMQYMFSHKYETRFLHHTRIPFLFVKIIFMNQIYNRRDHLAIRCNLEFIFFCYADTNNFIYSSFPIFLSETQHGLVKDNFLLHCCVFLIVIRVAQQPGEHYSMAIYIDSTNNCFFIKVTLHHSETLHI